MKLPRLIGTDVDGVWTDGGMYYDNRGNELKRFSTFDGMGVALSRAAGIPLVIMTGEDTQIVTQRAKKLKIDLVFQGVKDKARCMSQLADELGIGMAEVAYIGDDLNDLSVIRSVGYSACPSSATPVVQNEVDFVIPCQGGHGAFRAFIEHLLGQCGMLETAINKIVTQSVSGT